MCPREGRGREAYIAPSRDLRVKDVVESRMAGLHRRLIRGEPPMRTCPRGRLVGHGRSRCESRASSISVRDVARRTTVAADRRSSPLMTELAVREGHGPGADVGGAEEAATITWTGTQVRPPSLVRIRSPAWWLEPKPSAIPCDSSQNHSRSDAP